MDKTAYTERSEGPGGEPKSIRRQQAQGGQDRQPTRALNPIGPKPLLNPEPQPVWPKTYAARYGLRRASAVRHGMTCEVQAARYGLLQQGIWKIAVRHTGYCSEIRAVAVRHTGYCSEIRASPQIYELYTGNMRASFRALYCLDPKPI